jgi:hypothetical protein
MALSRTEPCACASLELSQNPNIDQRFCRKIAKNARTWIVVASISRRELSRLAMVRGHEVYATLMFYSCGLMPQSSKNFKTVCLHFG